MAIAKRRKRGALIVVIEALHDAITGNYILYTEEAIDSVLSSWTNPYNKPFILHHKDADGRTVGRVIRAEKKESVVHKGLFALVLTCKISDTKTIDGIYDGRYFTTSVGVSGTEVECSICGHKVSSGVTCQHKRGLTYRNKQCYWIVKEMIAKEISFVIVPSDPYSQIISYYEEGKENEAVVLKESLDQTTPEVVIPLQKGSQGMNEEELKLALKEAKETIISLEASNAVLAESNTELTESNASLQTSLAEVQGAHEQEIALREGLEAELESVKVLEKERLIENIVSLRESLGLRKIEKENFESKTFVSLQEALEDLELELSFKESLNPQPEGPEEPEVDPTTFLKEAHVNNTQIVLKEQQHVRIDASAIVSNILD